MAQEQAYKPEHEKVVKVKFKPFFKRRYAPMDDQLTLEQVDTPKEKIQSIGDVTTAAVSYTHLDVYKRQMWFGW